MLKEYLFSWPKGSWGGKGHSSSVVLGLGSIFNHSDNNNADWITDENRNIYSFYATKDIRKGEEIFTNYGKHYKDFVGTNTIEQLKNNTFISTALASLRRKKRGLSHHTTPRKKEVLEAINSCEKAFPRL